MGRPKQWAHSARGLLDSGGAQIRAPACVGASVHAELQRKVAPGGPLVRGVRRTRVALSPR
eukprot:GDKH01003750.1.p1 GENE.GDKH01003750.1~~GDKH01003750.1.p1  ORF type:complete len:61 (-),score=5.05 GDKH01003750.1:73-255(-)